MTPHFIVHEGRIYPIIAMARVNNVPSVVVRSEHAVMTIPLAVVKVPQRPVLATVDGVRV